MSEAVAPEGPAISVDGVGKRFRRYREKPNSLKERPRAQGSIRGL